MQGGVRRWTCKEGISWLGEDADFVSIFSYVYRRVLGQGKDFLMTRKGIKKIGHTDLGIKGVN